MRKLLFIMMFLLAFTSTVSSSKSELTYEIYYDDPKIDLVAVIEKVEVIYHDVTAKTVKDDIPTIVRFKIDEFIFDGVDRVVLEENCVKVYLQNSEKQLFRYRGSFKDYCENTIFKESWLPIWNL